MSNCSTNFTVEDDVLASSNASCQSAGKTNPVNQQVSNINLYHVSTISNFSSSNLKFPSSTSLLRHQKSPSCLKRMHKQVKFKHVELYHFDRVQGFTCVPSQGGSTLGMTGEHWAQESVSVSEHQTRRRNQRNAALMRFCLEGKLLLSLQQFRILERRVKAASSTKNATDIISNINEYKPTSNGSCAHNNAESSIKGHIDQSAGLDDTDGCLKEPCAVYGVCLEPYERLYPDESEEDLHFLDSLDEYYFLQPLPIKKRRVMLRRAGIQKIDSSEKADCQMVRISRTECGCTCLSGVCDPVTCQCALSGISCQVDRTSFPCTCVSPTHCQNPAGRIEFNPVRVKAHYLHTRMRLELEKRMETDTEDESLINHKRAKIMSNDVCSSSESLVHSSEMHQTTEVSETMLAAMNTTLQGGCRDCHNNLYIRVLMQELANHEHQQQEEAASKEIRENLAFEQNSGSSGAHTPSSVIDSGRSSAGSVEDYSELQEAASSKQCILDETSEDVLSMEGDDDDDDEEDDEEDEMTACGEYIQSASSAVPDSSSEQQKASSSGLTSLHLCRLEPISSLFHNAAYHSPHQCNTSTPTYIHQAGSESPIATSAPGGSPSRPPPAASPSLCEVVSG